VAELPLACSLDAGEGAPRLARWRALTEQAPPRAERRGHELALWWRLDSRGVNELEALAAAERECCAFVTWSISRQEPYTVLTVAAAPGRPEDLDAIGALFAAS
jgi:hypothetical protein